MLLEYEYNKIQKGRDDLEAAKYITPTDQILRDVGCSEELIDEYLSSAPNTHKQVCILEKQRKLLLQKLHENQKQIDNLDFLLYQQRKNI